MKSCGFGLPHYYFSNAFFIIKKVTEY